MVALAPRAPAWSPSPGPGGSGKTRLAIEAAAELVGEFKNGVLLGRAGDASTTPAHVLPTVAQTIGATGRRSTRTSASASCCSCSTTSSRSSTAAPELADLVEACAEPEAARHVPRAAPRPRRGRVRGAAARRPRRGRALLPPRAQLSAGHAGRGALPPPRQHAARARARRRPDEGARRPSRSSTGSATVSTSSRAAATPRSGRRRCARRSSGRTTCSTPTSNSCSRRLGVFAGGCDARDGRAGLRAPTSTRSSRSSKRASSGTPTAGSGCSRRSASMRVERLAASGREDALRRRHAGALPRARRVGQPLGRERSSRNARRSSGLEAGQHPGGDRLGGRPLISELAFRLAIAMEQFWVINDAFEGVRRLAALLDRGEDRARRCYGRARCGRWGESIWIVGGLRARAHAVDGAGARRIRAARRPSAQWPCCSIVFRSGRWSPRTSPAPDSCSRQSLAICRARPNAKTRGGCCRTNSRWVERGEGNRERALELFEESARLCEQVGFTLDAGKRAPGHRRTLATSSAGPTPRKAGRVEGVCDLAHHLVRPPERDVSRSRMLARFAASGRMPDRASGASVGRDRGRGGEQRRSATWEHHARGVRRAGIGRSADRSSRPAAPAGRAALARRSSRLRARGKKSARSDV